MDVLVLGNGFDLAHKLPTTYLCFLKTTGYITKLQNFDGLSIGRIFESLQNDCGDIANSYCTYKSVYDDYALDPKRLKLLRKWCKSTEWWLYFKKTFNKNVGWIDFEKEIAIVVNKIKDFLYRYYKSTTSIDLSKKGSEIIKYFDFFIEQGIQEHMQIFDSTKVYYRYKSDYIIKHGNDQADEIDKRKIAIDLFQSLTEFSEILSLYFEVFVDEPLEKLKINKLISTVDAYREYPNVITYNYTNSLERLYDNKAAHIHGSLGSKIILGINSNVDDDGGVDLSFIDFKKYYQRVIFKTDLDYLSILTEMKRVLLAGGIVTLSIIGHSLDYSDKDSLEELFDSSNKINVYYHREDNLPEYVQKIIKIFGKAKFDELRFYKNLQFFKQEDFSGPPPLVEAIRI